LSLRGENGAEYKLAKRGGDKSVRIAELMVTEALTAIPPPPLRRQKQAC
jgi:hypothetical protein